MKIATFNINNVRKRLPNLLAWLRSAEPDVVCLQELKAADAASPEAEIRKAGYGAVWRGQRTYNGVAILAKGGDPVLTRDALPGDPGDDQCRYIEAAVNGVLVASIYLPNGNPKPGPKFNYKLAWFERLISHAATLCPLEAPVVLAGDFNVVPTNRCIYPTRSWPRMCCSSRRAERRSSGSSIRAGSTPFGPFTLTSRCTRGARDAGLRIDFLLLNPVAADRLIDAGVDRSVRSEEGASDHAPSRVILR
jgi:exodeoxyribonuclease-3